MRIRWPVLDNGLPWLEDELSDREYDLVLDAEELQSESEDDEEE